MSDKIQNTRKNRINVKEAIKKLEKACKEYREALTSKHFQIMGEKEPRKKIVEDLVTNLVESKDQWLNTQNLRNHMVFFLRDQRDESQKRHPDVLSALQPLFDLLQS